MKYLVISPKGTVIAEIPAIIAKELFEKSKGFFKPYNLGEECGAKIAFEMTEAKQYDTYSGITILFFKGTIIYPSD